MRVWKCVTCRGETKIKANSKIIYDPVPQGYFCPLPLLLFHFDDITSIMNRTVNKDVIYIQDIRRCAENVTLSHKRSYFTLLAFKIHLLFIT